MTIYIDVVLLENLIMNFIILFTTGVINKVKINYIRIALASLIGSVYAIIAYLNILPIYSNIVTKIILSVAMIFLSFNPIRFKTLLKQLLIFYLTSFVFGGCAFFLLYFVKPQNIFMRNGIYTGSYPIKIAIIGGLIGCAVIITAFNIIKNKFTRKEMFCNVNINCNDKQARIKALIDTGNLLKEPITKIPVVVAETGKMQNILPQNVIDNIDKIINGNLEDVLEEGYISRFRIIPFNSLGKENGILLGFKVDNIQIELEDRIITKDNIILGLYNQKLHKNSDYSGLIGLELLEGSEDENEHFANVKK